MEDDIQMRIGLICAAILLLLSVSSYAANTTHIIKQGDTLGAIAVKFGLNSSKDIIEFNNLDSTLIRVGQTIRIPSPSPEASIATNTDNKTNDKEEKLFTETGFTNTYKVKSGDTLSQIAEKFNVKTSKLKEANNLRNSDSIGIGQKLSVPETPKVSKLKIQIYTVKKGDTLSQIARNFSVSVRNIKTANGLRTTRINTGDKLIIPTTKTTNNAIIDYRVRSGDTLSSIARKYSSTVTKIKRANNLIGDSIHTGQKLKVPLKLYVSKSAKEKILKDELIKVAKRYLGAPYKFGGTSTQTGIDCSAYVNKVFRTFNVNLPRTARDIYKKGQYVSKNNLEKGDLVFFATYAKYPSHVGIYIGNNKFIHASSISKKITIGSMNKSFYKKRYIGAKRISIKNGYAKKIRRS